MTEILTSVITAVPWWVRLLLALVFLVAGSCVTYYVSFRGGILLLGAGFVFLMFSSATDAEKNGYRF